MDIIWLVGEKELDGKEEVRQSQRALQEEEPSDSVNENSARPAALGSARAIGLQEPQDSKSHRSPVSSSHRSIRATGLQSSKLKP